MIRRTVDQDKSALGEIYCSSWKQGYRTIVPDAYLDALTAENCTPQSLNYFENLVFDRAGKILGLVNFGCARDNREERLGELRAIYVVPDVWRQSVGKSLFAAAVDSMKAQGFVGFYLWVLKDNSRACAFYEKMGMVNTNDERTISIGGRTLIEVRYMQQFVR